MSQVVPQTDILALRRIETPGERIAAVVQPTTNPIPVIDDGDNAFAVNDFAVIGNCEQAAVFRVTAVGNALGNVTLAWDPNTGGGVNVFQNAAGASLSGQNVSYGSALDPQGTTVARITTDIYYIGNGSGTNNFGDTTRSLWRKSGTAAPQELVEGVRDLQVWYGIDTAPNDNSVTPTRYVTADNVGNNIIRAIRVQIAASTIDVVTDNPADEPITRTFSQTISLRNLMDT